MHARLDDAMRLAQKLLGLWELTLPSELCSSSSAAFDALGMIRLAGSVSIGD
jgi:hypothetical protein